MLGLCDQYIIIYKHICKIDVMPISFRHMCSLEISLLSPSVVIISNITMRNCFLCLFAALMPPRWFELKTGPRFFSPAECPPPERRHRQNPVWYPRPKPNNIQTDNFDKFFQAHINFFCCTVSVIAIDSVCVCRVCNYSNCLLHACVCDCYR